MRRAWGPTLLLLVIAACSGGEPPVQVVREQVVFGTDRLDFGDVFIGAASVRQVGVENIGAGPVTLSAIGEGPYELQPAHLRLAAGERAEVTVRFQPMDERRYDQPVGYTGSGDHVFTIPVEGAGVGRNLVAEPTSLQFGEVAVGEEAILEVVLRNTADGELYLSLSHGGATTFSSDTRGIDLLGRAQLAIEVTFRPTGPGHQNGWLRINPCSACRRLEVPLEGMGVAPKLDVSPRPIHFGEVPLALQSRQAWYVRNLGNTTGRLGEIRLEPAGGPFALDLGATPQEVIEPGETVEFGVVFNPEEEGTFEGTLSLGEEEDRVTVDLIGSGGGPFLEAEPLDLGVRPIGFPSTAFVTLRNSGDLERVEVVSAALEGAGAFSLGTQLPVAFDGETLRLEVTMAAAEPGIHEGALVLRTDRLHQPELRIPLVGKVAAPACDLEITPSGPIRLGLVDGAVPHDIEISITHQGEGDCLIWGLELEGPPGPLVLQGGAIPGFQSLSPGVPWEVRVIHPALALGQTSDLVESKLVFSHSEIGVKEELPLSLYPARPFPFDILEPVSFPATPVGRESVAFVKFSFSSTGVWRDPISSPSDEIEPFGPLTTGNGHRFVPLVFTPTVAGERTTILELTAVGIPEPYLLPVTTTALASCPAPCDWPTLTCDGWAPVIGGTLNAVDLAVGPTPASLSCNWVVQETATGALSSSLPAGSCSEGGRLAFAHPPGWWRVEAVGYDEQGRAARCEELVDRSDEAPPGG